MFKIGAIGAGHMGMTILDAITTQGLAEAGDILVYELDERRRRLAKTRGFAAAGNESEVYANVKLLLLAIPPQGCEELLFKLARSAKRQAQKPTIINIMAGISSDYIRKYLDTDTAVITVMPTLGMRVGQGAAAIAHTDNIDGEILSDIMGIFTTTGEAIIVEEPFLKEIVAVNGCMPGYVFYMLDAFARAAEAKGIDYRTAVRMAARGFAGSAAQVLEEIDPRELLAQVCTPGGLTAKGIESFNENQVDKLLAKGMESSIKRGYELAR